MARAVAPFGLRPVRTLSGAPWSASVMQVLIPAADGTAVFVGDLVKTYGTGGTEGTIVNGINVGGMPTAIQGNHATATAGVIGVVVGFLPEHGGTLDNTNSYRKASTDRIALVSTGRDTVYEIQEDGVGANWAAVDIGLCANLNIATGNTTTGRSKVSLDSSVAAASTATLPIKVLGLARRPDNYGYGTGTADVATFECVLQSTYWGQMAIGV